MVEAGLAGPLRTLNYYRSCLIVTWCEGVATKGYEQRQGQGRGEGRGLGKRIGCTWVDFDTCVRRLTVRECGGGWREENKARLGKTRRGKGVQGGSNTRRWMEIQREKERRRYIYVLGHPRAAYPLCRPRAINIIPQFGKSQSNKTFCDTQETP